MLIVGVSSCVTTCEWCPMPDDVLEQVKEKSNCHGGMTVVCGLDGYAELLSEPVLQELYAGLKTWIDAEDDEPAALFVICEAALPRLRTVFENPRYGSGKKIIYVRSVPHNAETVPSPAIYLVSDRWFNAIPPNMKSIPAYLQAYEESTLHGETAKIAVSSKNGKHWAGLRSDVKQVMTLRDFMASIRNVNDPSLSDAALERLYEMLDTPSTVSINDFIAADSVHREIVLWRLKQQTQPDTYLGNVLCAATPQNFLECFVWTASNLLAHPDAKILAQERKQLMAEAGLQAFEPHIPQFIEMTRNEPAWQRVIWLNNGSDVEKAELLRILGNDFSERIRSEVFAVYPEVCAYLSADENEYFTEYRKLKVQNKCTAVFAQKAFECSHEPTDVIKSRNYLLKDYKNDGATALLVVDGMGAEWLPMIKTLAVARGLRVVAAMMGYVQLPTTTELNKIEWATERKLPEIKMLDNMAHDGEEKHTVKSDEDNLRAQLEIISKRILLDIGKGLAKHKRVLLTADHGSSRLALCAWNQGIANTLELPQSVEILDWRYCRNAPETKDLEKTLLGGYSVVRGYNRLSKSGGKIFELHGGATLEERLVPVIVFERGAAQKSVAVAQQASEVEEDDMFADL